MKRTRNLNGNINTVNA